MEVDDVAMVAVLCFRHDEEMGVVEQRVQCEAEGTQALASRGKGASNDGVTMGASGARKRER